MKGLKSMELALASTASQAPDPPKSVELAPAYKPKRCKYCRVWSTMSTVLPLGVFTSWDPLMPWQAGKKTQPKGLCCKICFVAIQLQYI